MGTQALLLSAGDLRGTHCLGCDVPVIKQAAMEEFQREQACRLSGRRFLAVDWTRPASNAQLTAFRGAGNGESVASRRHICVANANFSAFSNHPPAEPGDGL